MASDLIPRLCRSLAVHLVESENTLKMMVGDSDEIAEFRGEIETARALIVEAGLDIDAIYPVAERPVVEEVECCIACNAALRPGDDVYADANGGLLHARCCGPERESYTSADGGPLKDGEPIPQPQKWEPGYGR